MRLFHASAQLRALRAAAVLAFLSNAFDGFIVFTLIVQPLVIALLGLWILQGTAEDYGIYVVVGSGLTGLWSGLLFISGNSITSERWSGTLELMVGIPTPLQVIVFGKNLSNVIQSLASMVIAYALISLLFGYPLAVQQPALFFVSLIFLIMSFVCFGLMLAPFFVVNPAVQQWQNGLEFPVYILCGFLFPIALLPGWTTPLSYVLAPYWAARALHGASSGGAGLNEIVFCWAMMLGLSLLYLVVSGWLFKAVLKKARTDATLRMQ